MDHVYVALRWPTSRKMDHVYVAITLGNLGSAYRDLGDAARAKELYERALAIKEAALGRTT